MAIVKLIIFLMLSISSVYAQDTFYKMCKKLNKLNSKDRETITSIISYVKAQNCITARDKLKNLIYFEPRSFEKTPKIHTLKPLRDLYKLRKIDIIGEIKDLGPLTNLKNLETISIVTRYNLDLKPLKKLIKLRHLSLNPPRNVNRIYQFEDVDLSPLSGLHRIVFLSLIDFGITNITPLMGLGNLGTLILKDNYINNISAIRFFDQLKQLDLSFSTEKDLKECQLDPLRNLSKMRKVYFAPKDCISHIYKDISRFIKLDKMRGLNLSNTNLKDFSFLAKAKNLKFLYLHKNPVENLDVLRKVNKNLKFLGISKTQIKDFSFLEDLKHLETLNANFTSLKSVDFITKGSLKRRFHLTCHSCKISNIDILNSYADEKHLIMLEIMNSDIKDLSKMTSEYLTGVLDGSPVFENPDMTTCPVDGSINKWFTQKCRDAICRKNNIPAPSDECDNTKFSSL